MDIVQRDAMQIERQVGLRRRTGDREQWKHLSREARAREGVVALYILKNIYVAYEDLRILNNPWNLNKRINYDVF